MNQMKTLYTLISMLTLSFTSLSQIQDTCEYVDQNNDIGGLDCFVGSNAPFTADSYQWLNCDNSYAPIPGQTNWDYSGTTSITVALELTYLGCVDTSYCYYACTWALDELNASEREIVKIVDLMGRESKDQENTVLIYVYSDGTAEKRVRIE